MMLWYSVRWDIDYHVGASTDGRDWVPLGVVFDKPKPAIRYADMRQQEVSPLRDASDADIGRLTPAHHEADIARTASWVSGTQ